MTSDHVCFIVPPHVLIQMIDEGSPDQRSSALRTLAISERVRERRAVTRRLVQHAPQAAAALLLKHGGPKRTVYDVNHGSQGDLPGAKKRAEGDGPAADAAVIETRYDDVDELLTQVSAWLAETGAPADEIEELTRASMEVREFVVVGGA